MSVQVAPDNASILNLDLWSRVLSLVQADVLRAAETHEMYLVSEGCYIQQALFYRLRMVCKAFNEAFLTFPQLCRSLILNRPIRSVRGLMTWLKRHHGSVQKFAGFAESPTEQMILSALSQRPSVLRRLYLQQCSWMSLACLKGSESLTSLELAAPMGKLDLSQLRLPHLQRLVLQNGFYYSPCLPEHFSSLTLSAATLVCQLNETCATSLKKLKLSDKSRLQGLHSRGVVGCSALEGMTCLESLLVTNLNQAASTTTDLCCTGPVQLPAEMSALTKLLSLEVVMATMDAQLIDPLYGLGSLQSLNVHTRGADSHVTRGLQALTCLTSLTLHAGGYHNGWSLFLDTNWDGMKQLQVLDISCTGLDCTPSLLGLANIPSLRSVNISNTFRHGSSSAVLGNLISLLRRQTNVEYCFTNPMAIQTRHKCILGRRQSPK